MDAGACVVGRPASAFRRNIDGYADFDGEVADGPDVTLNVKK